MDPISPAAPAQLSTDLRLQILSQTLGFKPKGPIELGSASADTPAPRGHRAQSDQGLGQVIEQAQADSAEFSESFNGRIQRFRLEQTQRSSQLSVSAGAGDVEVVDPLAIDLGGNGFHTRGIAQGIDFDMNGDGQVERSSFVTGDDYFLALDRNANGRIDSGLELFGDQRGSEHGFAELGKLDSNADGVINSSDELFAQLRLVTSDAQGRLVERSLASAGVVEIGLSHLAQTQALNQYDRISHMGKVSLSDGQERDSADLLLATRKV